MRLGSSPWRACTVDPETPRETKAISSRSRIEKSIVITAPCFTLPDKQGKACHPALGKLLCDRTFAPVRDGPPIPASIQNALGNCHNWGRRTVSLHER